MPTTFSCTHCTKSFGKHEKLQRHLLTDHHGELRLSPGRAADCEAIGDVLAEAVDAANAAFADLPPGGLCPCALCADSCKPFRNAMDLAQHLVAKHDGRAADVDGDGTVGDMKKVGAQSEVSASGGGKKERGKGRGGGKEKGKRTGKGNGKKDEKGAVSGERGKVLGKRKANMEANDGDDKVIGKNAGNKATATKKCLQEDVNNGIKENANTVPAKPTERTSNRGQTIVAGGINPGSQATNFAKGTEDGTSATGRSSGMNGESDGKASEVKKRRMSAPAELTASGTKPPITPKKKVGQSIEWIESHGIRLPRQAAIRATTMNFSYFGGFSAYSHKSYYRLVDR